MCQGGFCMGYDTPSQTNLVVENSVEKPEEKKERKKEGKEERKKERNKETKKRERRKGSELTYTSRGRVLLQLGLPLFKSHSMAMKLSLNIRASA